MTHLTRHSTFEMATSDFTPLYSHFLPQHFEISLPAGLHHAPASENKLRITTVASAEDFGAFMKVTRIRGRVSTPINRPPSQSPVSYRCTKTRSPAFWSHSSYCQTSMHPLAFTPSLSTPLRVHTRPTGTCIHSLHRILEKRFSDRTNPISMWFRYCSWNRIPGLQCVELPSFSIGRRCERGPTRDALDRG